MNKLPDLINSWELFNEEIRMNIVRTVVWFIKVVAYHFEYNTALFFAFTILCAMNIYIWLDTSKRNKKTFEALEKKWEEEE